jgi:hypothetical protein
MRYPSRPPAPACWRPPAPHGPRQARPQDARHTLHPLTFEPSSSPDIPSPTPITRSSCTQLKLQLLPSCPAHHCRAWNNPQHQFSPRSEDLQMPKRLFPLNCYTEKVGPPAWLRRRQAGQASRAAAMADTTGVTWRSTITRHPALRRRAARAVRAVAGPHETGFMDSSYDSDCVAAAMAIRIRIVRKPRDRV